MFSRIKVWSKTWTNSEFFNKEWRIYVDMQDGRRGCLYLTGNPYQAKGSLDGRIKPDEWELVRKLSIWDGAWHTLEYGEILERTKQLDNSILPAEMKKQDRWDYLEIGNAQ